jgi:hypothetical protein
MKMMTVGCIETSESERPIDSLDEDTALHRNVMFQKEISTHYQRVEVSQGVAVPVQTWTGPEVSRRFRISDFNAVGT